MSGFCFKANEFAGIRSCDIPPVQAFTLKSRGWFNKDWKTQAILLPVSSRKEGWVITILQRLIHREEKRWQLDILSQYLANQTKPIGHIERYVLMAVVQYTNSIALVKFEWLKYSFCLCYMLFLSFCAQSIVGKCTSRHLFSYGGLQ